MSEQAKSPHAGGAGEPDLLAAADRIRAAGRANHERALDLLLSELKNLEALATGKDDQPIPADLTPLARFVGRLVYGMVMLRASESLAKKV